MNMRWSIRTVGPFERMEDFLPAARKIDTPIRLRSEDFVIGGVAR